MVLKLNIFYNKDGTIYRGVVKKKRKTPLLFPKNALKLWKCKKKNVVEKIFIHKKIECSMNSQNSEKFKQDVDFSSHLLPKP